jgi:TRAP-type C4-dicarboxylate transport system substrate-binding protein
MNPATIGRRRFVRYAASASAAAAFAAPLRGLAETVLKMSLPVAANDPMSVTSLKFADFVAKKSNGSLRIQMYYNGTLAKQQASISGMQRQPNAFWTATLGKIFPPRWPAKACSYLHGGRTAGAKWNS